MKRSVIVLIMALVVSDGLCRVPENLLGTDIFPDKITFSVTRKQNVKGATKGSYVQTSTDVEVSLPTKALNLAYGAECFTACCQPLYQFGELVRIEEIECRVPAAAAGGAGAAGAERPPVENQRTVRRINHFYKEIVKKEPLTYAECNPLAILVRALFWQNPGTSGLADFRVAQSCIVKNSEGKEDLALTMDCWADAVAIAMRLDQIDLSKQALEIKSIHTAFTKAESNHPMMINALRLFEMNITQKPNMTQLLFDCITWSEKNALEKDFTVRVLMGAVYALAGHDKRLIAHFYQSLQSKMAKLIEPVTRSSEWPAVTAKIDRFGASAETATTEVAAPGGGEAVDTPAARACALLQKCAGGFDPVAYGNANFLSNNFPDCFETMMRNIVLALLLQTDGTFKSGAARAEVDTFLTAYPSMVSQSTAVARNAWALLVSNIPGALYVRPGQYELNATCVNMLFMLNYLFNLEIPEFTGSFLTRTIAAGGDNVFIQAVLPKVNTELAAKPGLGDAAKPIITVDNIESVTDTDKSSIKCVVKAQHFLPPLIVSIYCYGHGEVNLDSARVELAETGEFTFLERKIAGTPSADNIASNLALMIPSLTYYEADELLYRKLVIKHPFLLRMLYAVAASRYENDVPEYCRWLGSMVSHGFFDEKAVAAGVSGMQSEDRTVNRNALELFQTLVRRDQGFDEAVAAGVGGMQSEDRDVSYLALELLKELFKRGKGFKEAVQLAVGGMQSENHSKMYPALALFKALFAHGQGFAQAHAICADRSLNPAIFVPLYGELKSYSPVKVVPKQYSWQ